MTNNLLRLTKVIIDSLDDYDVTVKTISIKKLLEELREELLRVEPTEDDKKETERLRVMANGALNSLYEEGWSDMAGLIKTLFSNFFSIRDKMLAAIKRSEEFDSELANAIKNMIKPQSIQEYELAVLTAKELVALKEKVK